ncbi:MAG TPA: chemotaxis protein CheW [Mycobacteriales bacterium]|nr:chemotaxis protein CheW [Mycobacteriales bacterium]
MNDLGAAGLVTFRLGEREYATPLAEVREVVRLQGLADMPGMRPPLAGVLDLRGSALPVLDLRPGVDRGARGDVLVIDRGSSPAVDGDVASSGQVGVAVDQVRAVVSTADLPRAGAADRAVLPDYVVDVLRGERGVVLLVDLEAMVAAVRQPVPAGQPQPVV